MAGIFASTLSYAKGETGDPVQTPLVPEPQYEEFRKQWSQVLDTESKISKILDFDRDSRKYRDAQETKIPDYMMAAYRVYGAHEDVAAVAAETKAG